MPRFKGVTIIAMLMALMIGWAGPARADSGPGAQVSQQNDALMHELQDKIRRVEYLFQLEMFGVYGCMAGATLGVVTGVMHLSGISTLVMPYISTGCAFGFLVGPAAMMTRDYLNHFLHGAPEAEKAAPAATTPNDPLAPQPRMEKQGAARPGPMGWSVLGRIAVPATAG